MEQFNLLRFDEQASKDGGRVVTQIYTISNNDFIGTVFIQGGNTHFVTIFEDIPTDVRNEVELYEKEARIKYAEFKQMFTVDIQYIKEEFKPQE